MTEAIVEHGIKNSSKEAHQNEVADNAVYLAPEYCLILAVNAGANTNEMQA